MPLQKIGICNKEHKLPIAIESFPGNTLDHLTLRSALAKNIDGVYSADPKKDPNATKYSKISYDEVLAQHLAVMDTTATSLSMDNKIPVLLFALKDPENIIRAVMGEKIGTIVE